MLCKTFVAVLVAILAIVSYTPVVEAHSWADCIDWKFSTPSKPDWRYGKCIGYARRYPLNKPFGSLDSAYPNRHYMQNRSNPNSALPCSNGKAGYEPGSMKPKAAQSALLMAASGVS